jgi:hypothetical protein
MSSTSQDPAQDMLFQPIIQQSSSIDITALQDDVGGESVSVEYTQDFSPDIRSRLRASPPPDSPRSLSNRSSPIKSPGQPSFLNGSASLASSPPIQDEDQQGRILDVLPHHSQFTRDDPDLLDNAGLVLPLKEGMLMARNTVGEEYYRTGNSSRKQAAPSSSSSSAAASSSRKNKERSSNGFMSPVQNTSSPQDNGTSHVRRSLFPEGDQLEGGAGGSDRGGGGKGLRGERDEQQPHVSHSSCVIS